MLNKISLKARLMLLTGIAFILFVLVGVVGLTGINTLNKALEDIYKERMVPMKTLDDVFAGMTRSRTELLLAMQHEPNSEFLDMHNHPVAQHTDAILMVQEENRKAWMQLDGQKFTPENKRLVDSLKAAADELRIEGINSSVQALNNGNYYRANEIILTKINPALTDIRAVMGQLSESLMAEALNEFVEGEWRYKQTDKRH